MEDRKRRILHVIAALEGGGAERQLQILANNTDPERYHVSILFLHRGTGQYSFNEGIDLLQIPRGHKWNILSLWFRIYKAVKAYQPDIIQLWMPEIITIPAAFAGKFSGAYIISSARGSMRSVNFRKLQLRDLTRYIQHIITDKIVANFNPDKEPYFFRRLFSRKKGCVIPNAIVINQVKNILVPTSLTNRRASFAIWYVGRIIPSKRLDILLDSFVELRKEGLDISLVICGTGNPKLLRQLKEKFRANILEEHVIFLGYRDDWHSLAQYADLFVLPSTAEGMPNVLFEAMLLGIPCIAADIPVVSNIVSHKENIWLVNAGSQSSLAEGIRQMYQSASLRKEIAKKGQLYAGSFSIKRMSQAYNALYQQVY
ncbi:MAG: glycosyltransferase [Planctomycetota bacterium]|jgi:glycosyltransferase involved in cell wall biosynthesis